MFKLLLILVLVLLNMPARAETLRMGIGDWCPYVCDGRKADGQLGYITDIVTHVFEKQGFTVSLDLMPFSRNLEQTSLGFQHATLAMYKQDAPGFIFPEFHLGVSTNAFYAHREERWRYDGLMSLVDRKIGLIQGYDYADPDFMTFVTYNPDNVYYARGNNPLKHLLAYLLKGKINTLADDRLVVEYNLRKLDTHDKLHEVGQLGMETKVYVGFSPKFQRSAEFARLLDQGIKELRQSGDMDDILDTYGVPAWK